MKLATLCYVKRDGHTLMVYRNKKQEDYHQGKYNGLGGKLEPGESPEDCARREVLEESGLTVTSMCLRGIITFPLFDGKDDWYVFVYVIAEAQGELIDSPEGELCWIPDDDLLNLNLWPGDRSFLSWLDKGAFFSAKFVYERGRLKDYEVVFY